jgi:lysozyme
MATISGIDVSKWQGDIVWSVVAQQVKFALFKATEGKGYTDPKFARNQQETRRSGLLVGYYHFSRPDLNSALAEADYFLSVVKPSSGEILALDYEANWNGDVVGWCKTFLDRVSQQLSGYKPLIYLNRSLANGHDWSSVINANYGLWIASYDGNPTSVPKTPWPTTAMKQYSSSGSVPGIIGNVDMNTFFGNEETYKKYGYQGTPNGGDMSAELDACMADRKKFWAERDTALAERNDALAKLTDKTEELEALKKSYQSQISTIADLQHRLTECENKPSNPTDDTNWQANGKTVTTVVENISTTINYTLKG